MSLWLNGSFPLSKQRGRVFESRQLGIVDKEVNHVIKWRDTFSQKSLTLSTKAKKIDQMEELNPGIFHPAVWDTRDFTSLSADSSEELDTTWQGRLKELKKEVETMLSLSASDPFQELDLINLIQRLGLAYHFEDEIEQKLDRIYNHGTQFLYENDGADLYFTSLWFRLLREAGYYVSTDVFNKFRDHEKGEFHENLASDLKGILSLYESSYLSIRGEEIMDEALVFTTKHLNSMLATDLSPPLAQEIQDALKLPIRKCVERVQARQYISIYNEAKTRNETLLEFAKLDFNAVQRHHQKELKEFLRWFEAHDMQSKLPYETRDRGVESYVIPTCLFFEPQFSLGRIHLSKLWAAFSILDDAYDVYGNLDELRPLSDAFQRWDDADFNKLTDLMKVIFLHAFGIVNEIEGDMIRTGHFIGIRHFKKEIQEYTRGLGEEAEVLHTKDLPTFDQCIDITYLTTGIRPFIVGAVMHLGELATTEVFDWISSQPKLIHYIYVISRISDDNAAPWEEHLRGIELSCTACYMKEHGVSESVAVNDIENIITMLWKDINKELLRPYHVHQRVLKIIWNFACMVAQYYGHGVDAYTNSGGPMKEIVALLLVDPIPI